MRATTTRCQLATICRSLWPSEDITVVTVHGEVDRDGVSQLLQALNGAGIFPRTAW
ncbi:hypothetical protein [Streptomyces sp. NPDC051452]|uniref:hypothetical protein n=1 Tax=Streptomyces sp. NPDC051452 TaxID=3365654 RepID=UPI0037B3B067